MSIEGIEIKIIAGPYVESADPEAPAYIRADYMETGEITLTSDFSIKHIDELSDMAGVLGVKIFQNKIRRLKNGNHNRDHQ